MSDDFLKIVVSDAATIWERLAAPRPVHSIVDRELGARRLAAWAEACAVGDLEIFEQRLARDGLCREEIVGALGAAGPAETRESWAGVAEWIEPVLRRGSVARNHGNDGSPLPFNDLFGALVQEAELRLSQRIGAARLGILTQDAIGSLTTELARSVCDLCAPVLYDHFCRFRGRCGDDGSGAAGDSAYKSFLLHMQSDGFRALFGERPVLLRLLAVVVEQWIVSTAEFIVRLSADRLALAEFAGISVSFSVVGSEIVGDVHNHGRAVRRVDLQDGQQIFYKPKDLMVDELWGDLVADLNSRSPPFTLKVPRTLARSGYGWTECIEHRSCLDAESFDNYFRRAGGWLCLFQMFGATDMHEQNVIACGDHPVPVDLETLLQPAPTPDVADDDPRRAYVMAGAEIANSVLATGLLPAYGRRPGGEAVAHGGLLETLTPQRVIQWRDVNTDRMRPVACWTGGMPNQNRPHINHAYADIKNHSEAVAVGYAEYAAFFLSQVQARGGSAFTERFAKIRVRKLTKNTRFYSLLLDRLRDPRHLSDGALWSTHLDVVSRFSDWSVQDDPWWPLVGAERAALAELNIPHFTMDAAGSTICDVDDVVAQSGLQSGLDRVTSYVGALNPAEITRQAEIIRLSLTSVRAIEASLELRHRRRATAPIVVGPGDPTSSFLQSADSIARQLGQTAYRGSNSAAWLGLDWLQDSTLCQLAPLGVGLYNGVVGVALFLAAHAKVQGNPESARLALESLAGLRHDLLGPDAARSARALGIGGASGLGSVLYGLAVIAELTGDSALLLDALQISKLLSDGRVGQDAALDVMDGAAGAVLGLLKLYRATRSDDVLRRAEALGRRLVPGGASPSLLRTGLSHGPAGVALALVTLATELPNARGDELRAAAQAWIEMENAAFCPVHGGWPDARVATPETDTFWPCQWCHGAAGIGLARVSMASQLRSCGDHPPFSTTLDRDVERALAATKAAWPYATDSLCCGSLGGIELLTEVARYQDAPDLQALAQARLCETLVEAETAGDFLWDIADSSINIGLFRGVSGMGYALLRQADPRLPNILTWG